MDDFFIRYAERKLGRSLTEDEESDVEEFTNRREVRDWAKSIENNPKPVRQYRKKESRKDEQSVTNSESEEE